VCEFLIEIVTETATETAAETETETDPQRRPQREPQREPQTERVIERAMVRRIERGMKRRTETKILKIGSNTYYQLLRFAKHVDEYDRYFKIKQNTKNNTKEQTQYLNHFKLNKLNKLFRQMVSDFYEKYVATYVNKLNVDDDDEIIGSLEHKYRMLFEIHFIHLQTNKPIFKIDVERLFLYIIDSQVIIDSLKQLYDLCANQRVQYSD
jgi:hypothetical protein